MRLYYNHNRSWNQLWADPEFRRLRIPPQKARSHIRAQVKKIRKTEQKEYNSSHNGTALRDEITKKRKERSFVGPQERCQVESEDDSIDQIINLESTTDFIPQLGEVVSVEFNVETQKGLTSKRFKGQVTKTKPGFSKISFSVFNSEDKNDDGWYRNQEVLPWPETEVPNNATDVRRDLILQNDVGAHQGVMVI